MLPPRCHFQRKTAVFLQYLKNLTQFEKSRNAKKNEELLPTPRLR